jgi:hypothetical protein
VSATRARAAPVVVGAAIVAALLLGGACNQGGELANPIDFGAGADDLMSVAPPDLAGTADLAGPTCGHIVQCVIQCGLTDLTCDQTCFQGAQPEALQQAGALVLCAAQNCLQAQPDGGSGMLGMIQCLLQNCGTEVADCQGLLGGFGGPM